MGTRVVVGVAELGGWSLGGGEGGRVGGTGYLGEQFLWWWRVVCMKIHWWNVG